jgi:hypothetical protein
LHSEADVPDKFALVLPSAQLDFGLQPAKQISRGGDRVPFGRALDAPCRDGLMPCAEDAEIERILGDGNNDAPFA